MKGKIQYNLLITKTTPGAFWILGIEKNAVNEMIVNQLSFNFFETEREGHIKGHNHCDLIGDEALLQMRVTAK